MRRMILVAALIPMGCSPYAFRDQVVGLDDSLSRVAATRGAAATQLQADWLARRRITNIANRLPLRAEGCEAEDYFVPTTSTCLIMAGRGPDDTPPILPQFRPARDEPQQASHEFECESVDFDRRWATTGAAFASEARQGGARAVQQLPSPMAALTRYTNALKAITASADREAYNAAAGRLADGLKTIGLLAGPYGAVVGPAASLVTWLIGQELDWQRRRSLERAVRAACEPVRILAIAIGEELKAIRGVGLDGMNALLVVQLGALIQPRIRQRADDREYGARLDSAEATAARIRDLQAVHPDEVATAVRRGHDQLVWAVTTGEGDLESVTASISHLAQLVTTLDAAFGKAP